MQEGSVQRVGEAPTSVPFVASQNIVAISVTRGVEPACPRASSSKQTLPQSGPISAHQPTCPDDDTERSLTQLPPLESLAHRQILPPLRQSKGNSNYIDLFLAEKNIFADVP
jgi:hypothetical protein